MKEKRMKELKIAILKNICKYSLGHKFYPGGISVRDYGERFKYDGEILVDLRCKGFTDDDFPYIFPALVELYNKGYLDLILKTLSDLGVIYFDAIAKKKSFVFLNDLKKRKNK